MPTNRRRRRHAARGCSAAMRVYLESGHWFPLLDNSADAGEPGDEAARDAWDDDGEAIISAFIGLHPGFRPWAWWKWEAPEARRPDESEPAFLRRLGLLTGDEYAFAEKLRGLLAAGLEDAEIASDHDMLCREIETWRLALK